MIPRHPLGSRLPILSVLILLAASTLPADTTYTFQNGANSYSGSKDVSINTQYSQYNGGNGVLWRGDPELGCYNVSGTGGYSARYLLRFSSLGIPAGSQVVSATLTMSFDYWGSGSGNMTGFYLKNSWNPASNKIGWIHRDSTHDWAAPGASSAGTDTVAGKTFAVPPLSPVGVQTVSMPLDIGVVQSWINTPAADQGIMLVNNLTDDVVRPVSTAGTQSARPKLTIVIANGTSVQVTVSPTSATVQPGAQQTFSATVTGSANTAVTWTATGGTITPAGVYTAGSAPGSFSVKATSAADPTKSATATVTIPQPVQVTVSPANVTLAPGGQQTFTATVTGSANTAVTWTATGGTITAAGVYTAGSTAGPFGVTAKSVADPTKTASATVTIQAGVQVTVSPANVTLQTGQTQQFTATVTGSANTAVNWTATGGTISAGGLFTAGSTAGSFAVTAASAADPTKSASSSVTIQQPVQVTVSPASATLQTGQTKQFTATVTGSANTAVNWTATGGTISASGLFTAGSTAGSFTVTATSAADPTKSAAASVTIQQPVQVTVSPASVTLQTGQTQQFTATVTGSANTAVTWTATGGTISSGGLFTAGSTAGSFSVTATSVADTTKSASAAVTMQSGISVTISPTSAALQPGQQRQFTATVTGSANTAVNWTATGGTISSSGLYTAGQTVGNFAVTATSAADSSKSATAGVSITSTQALPPVPRQYDGAYVVVQSPASGMHFTAPATIRIYADPYDGDAPDPDALTVNFLINGQNVGSYTGSGAQNGYFALTVNNLAAGTYAVTAQINSLHHGTVTSAPVTIYVDNPAASSGPAYNLSADVVLTGTQTVTYAGTAANHCRIAGNGFQIRTASGFTGSLNISYCDIAGLGTATKAAIDATVNGSGSVQLTGNVFENFGTVSVAANDTAQLAVRNNEFRENTLVPVGSQPEDASTETVPVFFGGGNSSAQKFFQGNNVGLSTVVFENTRTWLIGGNTDAESNVLMGVRCGFRISGSSGMVLRGNYSQHNYPHRFSQGENFQLDGDGFLAEHNVIRSSSWPVRGMGGELRYNLIDNSGNSDQVLQAPMSNANIHHNIFTFTVSQTLYSPGAGLKLIYSVDNVQFHHNVMDGGGTFMGFYGTPVAVTAGSFLGSLRNNVFYNFAGLSGLPILAGEYNESTNPPLVRMRYADYNDFYNPDAPNQANYGLGVVGLSPGAAGYGMHDAGGFNGHANPKFTQPTAIPFPFRPEDVWNRAKKVSEILAAYRTMYTPAAGSPLLGTGDPQDGAGGNIGAIGNGEPADQFGRFGNTGTPGAPVIASFTASPSTVQAGQTVTLSWSVTGATSLSISPAPGTVTGTSVTVTPAATTTYTLTATNSSGSVTAPAAVTVTAPAVSVTVSPTSATLAPGATRQFTATVSGTANTAVTWSATGGSITTGGLYTAGATTGSFSVTATSVQDPSKSASAAITIAAPTVSVSVAPQNVTLLTGGTQQFTATVTGTANTAVTWTASGGTITSAGLYTAGATAGSFSVTATSVQDTTKSATTGVTIVSQTTSGRPRIILDAALLATLRARAQANTPQWIALKQQCDSMIGGTVSFPDGNAYPDLPNIGEGYQGSSYFDALMPLGICYQVAKTFDPTNAGKYGAKGVAILAAMSDPAHQTIGSTPIVDRDDGYGIRFYGVTMGIGYDWFHDLLSPSLETQLQNVLNAWITGWENDSPIAFEYEHVLGNYYAGYYAAKCYAALALEGDSALGATWWNDWYNHQHNQRVQPYYALNMAGGGWPEGFGAYGPLATRNMLLPALAVRSAKGIDLIHAALPFNFPLDQGRWIMHFTWPSRDMIDDRDNPHSGDSDTIWPGTGEANTYSFLAGYLAMWNDPLAPAMHKYARDAKTALTNLGAGDVSEWIEFVFWDNGAPEADYTSQTTSYATTGIAEVAARSDWSNLATWMSFRTGPYINNPGAGHQGFDSGSLALVRAKSPLLVNVSGWIMHNPNGGAGENAWYDDAFGNSNIDPRLGNRRFYNTFQVRHVDGAGNILDGFGQWALTRADGVKTKLARFEDGGSYVMALGQNIEDMYRPFQNICGTDPVTSWSREIVYLRPAQFVVYDRTGICNATLDQYLAFHFPAPPVEVAAPGPGLRRFDVSNGAFAGSMTTVLPASAALAITDQIAPDPNVWNKIWRSEIRPTGAASANRLWLTVFDLAGSAAQVAAAAPLTATSGPITGAVLQSAAGNSALVFGTAAAGTAITGTISYTVPAVQTRHVISDLAPNTGYSVAVNVTGGTHVVTITAGGARQASANGVLSFAITPAGAVQP